MTVQVGNEIFFERNKDIHEGIVLKIYDNSVLVEVAKDDIKKLGLPNNKTVVNHKRYQVKV